MVTKPAPVRIFEHTHGRLMDLTSQIGSVLKAGTAAKPGADGPDPSVAQLETLREELLTHFANEEELLFPFIREHLPLRRRQVDELEAAHNELCGLIVRVAHLAKRDGASSVVAVLYQRFRDGFTQHSLDEVQLFDELERSLTEVQQHELATLLAGAS